MTELLSGMLSRNLRKITSTCMIFLFTPGNSEGNSEGIFLMPKSHLLSGIIIIHVILYMTKNYRILQMSCQLMELVQLVAWAW